MSPLSPKTLLVVKNRALGDSLMSLSTIEYLRKVLPETRIIYGVPAWTFPLYKKVKTAADQIIPLNLKTTRDFLNLRRTLKTLKVDTVFELFQSGRTGKFFKAWSCLGGPEYVFHNHHTSEGKVFDQGVIKPNIQRDLDGAWTFFADAQTPPPNFLHYPPQIKVEKGPHAPFFVLGVVATRSTKMWKLNSYKKLSDLLAKKYPDHKIKIPLGPNDDAIKKSIIELEFHQNCQLVEVGLSELPLEVAGTALYIGNDTGLKHLTVALGSPTLTLFGPEPPEEWHPYDQNQHPYFYRTPLECRTRNAHYCGLSTCDSMICLDEFTPEQVFQKVCLIYK